MQREMFRRVFVLCTGRCGSLTFATACENITNYSVGHESRRKMFGPPRFNFPERHIEVDNRLSWFLGRLDEIYGPNAFYVHLTREKEAVAASFERRWEEGIIRAYVDEIHFGVRRKFNPTEIRGLCVDYWETVNANIRLFLKDKPHQMNFRIERAAEQFPRFWNAIGAEGDLERAIATFDKRLNASEATEG